MATRQAAEPTNQTSLCPLSRSIFLTRVPLLCLSFAGTVYRTLGSRARRIGHEIYKAGHVQPQPGLAWTLTRNMAHVRTIIAGWHAHRVPFSRYYGSSPLKLFEESRIAERTQHRLPQFNLTAVSIRIRNFPALRLTEALGV